MLIYSLSTIINQDHKRPIVSNVFNLSIAGNREKKKRPKGIRDQVTLHINKNRLRLEYIYADLTYNLFLKSLKIQLSTQYFTHAPENT